MKGKTMIDYKRRNLLKTGAAAAAALAVLPTGRVWAAADTIYVNTWGGSWTAAEDAAFYKPFTAATGIQVQTVTPVNMAQLKQEVESGTYDWDLVANTDGLWLVAEKAGLTQPIDFSVVDKDKLWPGAVFGTGIRQVSLAYHLTYRTTKYPSGTIKGWADFWNVEKFPGSRSLYSEPEYAVIAALLADGVDRAKLYPLDLDRAFKKLDEIKPHIKVWWAQNSQSKQLFRDGEVDMIGLFNAHSLEMKNAGEPCDIVWDGSILLTNVWGVAKGSPNATNAWKFIQFASQPEQQAAFAKLVLYGPENPDAYKYLPPELKAQLPTSEEHKAVSVPIDPSWYVDNYDGLKERFTQWMAM
jgi:putative spermidine/putrescine transport system substrate-binding protein